MRGKIYVQRVKSKKETYKICEFMKQKPNKNKVKVNIDVMHEFC